MVRRRSPLVHEIISHLTELLHVGERASAEEI
jgi:hypothetical protein